MSRRSNAERRPAGASRGFTLVEALVSLFILSVVMALALTLLVAMRSFAAKQQNFTQPRQISRSAVDYLGFYLAQAADLNVTENGPVNPNALIMYYSFGKDAASGGSTPVQASYNNLSAAASDSGTRGRTSFPSASRRTRFGFRSRPTRARTCP